jgi:LysR family transcriptional activator of nhaA
VRPQIAAELEDSALIKVFGQHGVGAFVVPSAIAAETCAQYGVTCFGETEAVRERFYAITVERRIRHPALLAIAAAAATSLGRGRG